MSCDDWNEYAEKQRLKWLAGCRKRCYEPGDHCGRDCRFLKRGKG